MPEWMGTVRALAHGELFIALLTQNFYNMKIFGRCRYWMSQYQKSLKRWSRCVIHSCPSNGNAVIIAGMENLAIEHCALTG
jgi:hypothetical protein